jgi:hypothetical protein
MIRGEKAINFRQDLTRLVQPMLHSITFLLDDSL